MSQFSRDNYNEMPKQNEIKQSVSSIKSVVLWIYR